MTLTFACSAIGFLLTTACAVLLYAGSPHQAMLRRALPARQATIAAALTLIAGTGSWIMAWNGFIGGLLALATWMTAAAALPFLFAGRAR